MSKIFLTIFIVLSIMTALPAWAIELIPASCRGELAQCGLPELIQVFVNFGMILLGLSGSVVLFFFIYGGFVWLTSGGSPEKIQKGKQVIVNSLIGLLIIFGAAAGVRYFQTTLGAGKEITGQGDEKCEKKSTPQDPWACLSLTAAEKDTRVKNGTCVKGSCLSRPEDLNYVCCQTQ